MRTKFYSSCHVTERRSLVTRVLMLALCVVLGACGPSEPDSAEPASAPVEPPAPSAGQSRVTLEVGEKTAGIFARAAQGLNATETRNLGQAIGFFAALGQCDFDTIESMLTEDHIQHNPGIPTGRGLVDFMRTSNTCFQMFETMEHMIVEGDFIFMYRQAVRPDGSGIVVSDVMRFDDAGRYAEHWDIIQPVPQTTVSGRGVADVAEEFRAPTQVDAQTVAANKELVIEFLGRLFNDDQAEEVVATYVGEPYAQHNPRVADGAAALLEVVSSPMAPDSYDVRHVFAQHDLVGTLSLVVRPNAEGQLAEFGAADLFRVRDGKIVEHWDSIQPVPPAEEFVHDNGLL